MRTIITVSTAIALQCLTPSVSAQEAINETRDVSANERVYIEAMRGEVEIRTSTAPQFSVQGTLDEEAEGFTLESANGFTRFVVEMPRSARLGGWNDNEEGSQLSIVVPQGSEVEFRGVNATVDIEGVTGGAEINTVNGRIMASGLSTFVQLSTVNGLIESRNNSGRVEMHSVNGEVDDSGSSGRVEYSTVNGQIRASSMATEISLSTVNGQAEANLQGTSELRLSTVNGDIDVRLEDATTPRIHGNTVSGDLQLTLEPLVSAKFSLNANAGGRIQNSLTADEVRREQYGPARRLNFSTGDGIGSVDLNSVSGQLILAPL